MMRHLGQQMEQRAECECGACRPGLRLVWDWRRGRIDAAHSSNEADEVTAFVRELLERAERGVMPGILCAVMGPDGRNQVCVVGAVRRSRTLARGIVAQMDDALAAMV